MRGVQRCLTGNCIARNIIACNVFGVVFMASAAVLKNCDISVGDDVLSLEQQLCFPLYVASNLIIRAYGPLLKPLKLTYPQYLVMMALWQRDGVSVGELGDRLHLDSGTLTPLLKRMEAAGHIDRRRNRDDERRVSVTLTSSGRKLKQKAYAVREALACQLAGEGERLPQLREDLKSLISRLEQSGKN